MSTQETRTSKTAEDHRYSDICGATNNRGDPCKLPAGWGTPGSGGTRCKFHGGLSSGPDDTTHLEDNDFAKDNDGGAPEANDNAAIHGGWSHWRNYYERLDGDEKEYVTRLVDEFCDTAAEHAPDVDPERREELAREAATLMILRRDASQDVWSPLDDDQDDDGSRSGSARGRGLILEDETGRQRVNPAHNAVQRLRRRGRGIAKELSLWDGFQ